MEFRILGPLEVVGDDGPLRLGGPRQRATLAILLLHANRVVPVERLADDLYAGAPPVTAVTQVQRQVSELRRLLGPGATLETRPPGYVLRLAPDELDLDRFERLGAEADAAAARGDPRTAAELWRRALDLWRGEPLADLDYEPFARTAIERLEELRLAALERRLAADLVAGRDTELVGELRELTEAHPLRERLHGLLMQALYRAGRQAEALAAYRAARDRLVAELGLEPSPALQALERAILTQDRALAAVPAGGAQAPAVLVLPSSDDGLDRLLGLAEPLGARAGAELVVVRLVRDTAELAPAAAALNARCAALRIPARRAALTTADPAGEAVRLARAHDAALVLLDAPAQLSGGELPAQLAALLHGSPADVAVLAGEPEPSAGDGVYVPFGGGPHDWAALELATWLAASTSQPLRLVGTAAAGGRRDASRLLADAALAVQRLAGVESEPRLIEPSPAALLAGVGTAAVVVAGLSPRWPSEGLGEARAAPLAARRPVVVVHRGPRPGALAPRESRTRFTWSFEG